MDLFIFDYICNIFNLLFFLKYFSNIYSKKIIYNYFLIILSINFIFSLVSSSHINIFWHYVLELLLIYSLFEKRFLKLIIVFLKYELLILLQYTLLFIFHSLILWDFKITISSNYYYEYKNVICYSLIYILYILYTNSQKLNNNRKYKYYFNTIIIISLFTLSYVTLYICKNIATDNFIITLLFTAIYILIAIMITMYDRFILILNENAQAKISLEKAMLEEDYAQNIDLKLKELLSIRHDIKNHLNTIDGMLKDNAPNNARNYIHKIQNDFADTYIIATPCNTISNILNYKYQICLNKNIKFEYEGNFTQIYIDDYKLITILGNLIDNAITATTKLDELSRSIRLSITQIKSYLDITITNTHKENIKTLGNDFLSTKENHLYELTSMFHGIGLKNVRAITKRLNGELDIHYTDDTFFVSVMIPNYFKE